MDTQSLNKKPHSEPIEAPIKGKDKEINKLDNKVITQEEEIKQLKESLKSAKEAVKVRTGDIRQSVNREGDEAKVCIGANDKGQRVWKKATTLTDADIKRRNEYIQNIRQMNAKKQ